MCMTPLPLTLGQDSLLVAVVPAHDPLRLLLAPHDLPYALNHLGPPRVAHDLPQLADGVLDVLEAYARAPDAVAVRVHEPDALESVHLGIRVREHGRDGAGREERGLADVERAEGGEGREEGRVAREGRVAPELVRGEGHVGERDVLDRAPGGDGADEVVRR